MNFLKMSWNVIKKIIKVIDIIIMTIAFIISMIIIVQRVSNNENALLGYRIFRVETGSMIPKYLVGDVILVKERNIDEIKVGDDISYYGSSGSMKGRVITHQVIRIEEKDGQKTFYTKGLANNVEDPVIYPEQINGVVSRKIYSLTFICGLFNNLYIFYFIFIIPITIYVFFAFAKTSNKKEEEYERNPKSNVETDNPKDALVKSPEKGITKIESKVEKKTRTKASSKSKASTNDVKPKTKRKTKKNIDDTKQ